METAILVALGLVVGLAIAGLAVFIARPRTPAEDPAATQRTAEQMAAAQMADQRIVELGARVQQMGELLAKAQTQLQSSVHERLDAVTAHLGTSMQTSSKQTTENLQKLNERLAVIDSAQKNLTDLASQVTSLRERAVQQADPRRVRPGRAWKRSSRTGCRRAPTNSSTR